MWYHGVKREMVLLVSIKMFTLEYTAQAALILKNKELEGEKMSNP